MGRTKGRKAKAKSRGIILQTQQAEQQAAVPTTASMSTQGLVASQENWLDVHETKEEGVRPTPPANSGLVFRGLVGTTAAEKPPESAEQLAESVEQPARNTEKPAEYANQQDALPPYREYYEIGAAGLVETSRKQSAKKHFISHGNDQRAEVLRDALSFASPGLGLLAIFYDMYGKRLLPENPHIGDAGPIFTQNVYLGLERHMPHLRLEVEARIPRLQTTEVVNEAERFEEAKVHLRINYEAHKRAVWTDFHGNVDEKVRLYFEKLPQHIQTTVNQMEANGKHPMLLELYFDADKSLPFRVYMKPPAWATDLATAFKSGKVIALLHASGLADDQLDILTGRFQYQKKVASPFAQFYTPGRYLKFEPESITPIPQVPTEFHYQPTYGMYSKEDWMNTFAVYLLAERRKAKAHLASYCEGTHHLVLVPVPRSEDRAYYGFLPVRMDTDYQLTSGVMVRFHFVRDGKTLPEEWRAQIINEPIAVAPDQHYTLFVDRPWHDDQMSFSKFAPTVEKVSGRVRGELPNRIAEARGNVVELKLSASEHISKNLFSAINDINYGPKSRPRTDWSERVDQFLTGSRLDRLKPRDAFRSIREEFPDVTSVMELNHKQREAILQAGHTPGGLFLIQGPPGTGKSKILREIAKPFWLSRGVNGLLYLTPTNKAADTIALSLQAALAALQNQNFAQGKYGLRIYSQGSERAIRDQPAHKTRQPSRNRRPDTLPAVINWDELDACEAEMLSEYQTISQPNIPGIYDKRVQIPELSASRALLEITGVIQGRLTVPGNRFAGFRHCYRTYARGGTPEVEDFDDAANEAWRYTLQNASFIVATTTSGSMQRVLSNILDTTRLVMIDEAAHEQEVNLIALFAARFTNLDGFGQVGDFKQLQPHTEIDKECLNVFAPQGQIAFMDRLMMNGFPVTELTDQHRMVEDIADLANYLTYQGSLITSEGARVANRPMAGQFRAFVAQQTKVESNVLFLDLLACTSNLTRTNYRKSRYNEYFVVHEANLIRDLLALNEHATIAVLTGYDAQKQRLLKVKSEFARQKWPGHDHITIDTFDASQGEQYDYVVVDLLANEDVGKLGFLNDPRRLNVALTRARYGLVIIADKEAIRECDRHGRSFITKIIRRVDRASVKVLPRKAMPTCQFYKPPRTEG